MQVSLDPRHLRFLDRLVATGEYGTNRDEAASRVAAEWLEKNLALIEQKYAELDRSAPASLGSIIESKAAELGIDLALSNATSRDRR